MPVLIAIDSGTSSCRTVVFGSDGTVLGLAQREFTQSFPQPGWVEHDALEIRDVQVETLRRALADSGVTPSDVAGVGITNQRETVVVWDRRTGEPIHPAIVWQDRRTSHQMEQLAADGTVSEMIRARTGLVPDPYFCASKLQWIFDHVDSARAEADKGHLAFGTIECWLHWCMTGGTRHITDESNASRTMLYDIRKRCWDEDLLELFRIPQSILPDVVPCSGDLGSLTIVDGLSIKGMIGDQQSALFGQACFDRGDAKITYGTGCFLLMQTGPELVEQGDGLLSTIAWSTPNGGVRYAIEGSVFMGGASIQWLRDGLGIIKSAPEVNTLAGSVSDSDGVVVVPAFTGLGAPHWDPWGRAAIMGMTRGTTQAHIARATLDGIALSVGDLLHAMEQRAGVPLHGVRVDGGASASDLLMQVQADVLGIEVVRPGMLETTAWGAAAMAGLAAGVWSDISGVALPRDSESHFGPTMEPERRARQLRRWNRAVDSVRGWAKEDDDAAK
ncbi:MAG: glycerol kinase GlpK [Phycisphaerales bacterium]|nr:glycerol kinase GlpK [Phycisphaerales bacterium]